MCKTQGDRVARGSLDLRSVAPNTTFVQEPWGEWTTEPQMLLKFILWLIIRPTQPSRSTLLTRRRADLSTPVFSNDTIPKEFGVEYFSDSISQNRQNCRGFILPFES